MKSEHFEASCLFELNIMENYPISSISNSPNQNKEGNSREEDSPRFQLFTYYAFMNYLNL